MAIEEFSYGGKVIESNGQSTMYLYLLTNLSGIVASRLK